MFKSILIIAFMLISTVSANNGLQDVKSTHEVVEAKVEKVYSFKKDNHVFFAYAVKWNGEEIIVTDALALTGFKVGDTIKFLAQKVAIRDMKV